MSLNRSLRRPSIGVLSTLLICTMAANAHHAATNFDRSKTVTLNGTIKTFEWTNPHVWVWILVPGQSGGEAHLWGVESTNLAMARMVGMNKSSFKPGDKVTMIINPLKDGRDGGSLRKATFADGRVIDMGTPGG